jgi:hypothetical protein
MSVNSTIACIICRELLEAVMFTYTHLGAIWTNNELSPAEKSSFSRGMISPYYAAPYYSVTYFPSHRN